MRFLDMLIATVVLTSVLIFLFFIAWYIALPLFCIVLILAGIGFLKTKFEMYRFNTSFSHMKNTSERHKNKKIIDVEFTEIK